MTREAGSTPVFDFEARKGLQVAKNFKFVFKSKLMWLLCSHNLFNNVTQLLERSLKLPRNLLGLFKPSLSLGAYDVEVRLGGALKICIRCYVTREEEGGIKPFVYLYEYHGCFVSASVSIDF